MTKSVPRKILSNLQTYFQEMFLNLLRIDCQYILGFLWQLAGTLVQILESDSLATQEFQEIIVWECSFKHFY